MKQDREIATIGKVWRLLETLDADARARVLSYVTDKHECAAPAGTATVTRRDADALAVLQAQKPAEADLSVPAHLKRTA